MGLAKVWPGDVDLSKHTTETHQYSASSCVGNATADAVELLNSVQGLPKVQLSRLFIYSLARNLMDEDRDGRPDLDRDDGTYIRLAFDVLSKFGVCREDLPTEKGGWPYVVDSSGKPRNLHQLPSLKAMRAATGYRIHSYYRIDEDGYDRVEAVLAALRAEHPVVFGTLIDKAFTTYTGSQTVTTPTGPTIGGHAMMVCGYDRAKGFLIHNSWGKAWGVDGFVYLSEDYMAWANTWDLWVPTKGIHVRDL